MGTLLGGLGLFLLGMGMMSQGLQALAGEGLRGLLQSQTRTPARGVLAGLLATALIQSSSATTLATVGFVSAGLISFPAALGLIYGANLGTTTTAWIVSLIGLKVRIDLFALPLIGIGAGLRMLPGSGRGALGLALAGFGMLFLGIDLLQEGMAGFASTLDPTRLARPGLLGALLLVGVGGLMTVLLQSSSAAMATTLAAVHAGSLGLEQAALLAIGQNVGTTVTAAIGAAGGSLEARQTALAHLLFNLGTGIVALVIIVPFVGLLRLLATALGAHDPAVMLAAFHSAFNLLGLLIFFPQTERLARFVRFWVRERPGALTHRLLERASPLAEVRLSSAQPTVRDIAREGVELLLGCLLPGPDRRPREQRLAEAREALAATRRYLVPLKSDPRSPEVWQRHLSLLHAMDHLDHLLDVAERPEGLRHLGEDGPMGREASVQPILVAAEAWLERPGRLRERREIEERARALGQVRERLRPALLEATARGELAPEEAEARLDALRLAEAVGRHLGRLVHHLERAEAPEAGVAGRGEAAEVGDRG